jgi:kinesin family protein 15
MLSICVFLTESYFILNAVFELIDKIEKENPGSQYICRGSYVEIYNEYVYDLLDPLQTHRPIREDIKRGVYVDGATQEFIRDHLSALKLFQRGVANRHVSETAMNRESSRSHAVFTLTIQSKILRDGTFHLRESKLNMVDLAGSERQRDTRSDNARLKEAANINKSLLCLGGVINALCEIANGTQRHVVSNSLCTYRGMVTFTDSSYTAALSR